MDVITIESKAYKEIVAKIDVIANYVFSQEDTKNEDELYAKERRNTKQDK